MARVLVLSNHYPPHAYGGYELACYDAVRRWRSRGHDVAVLTSDHVRKGTNADRREDDATEVWRHLPMTWIQNAPPPKWRRPLVEHKARRALARAIDTFTPDVISVWNMAGLPLSLLNYVVARDLPIVALISDTWPIRAPREDPWIGPLTRNPTVGRVVGALTRLPTTVPDLDQHTRYAFVSESMREDCITASGWRYPSSTIVPLGVNLDDFPLVDAHDRPWSDRLLFVGRLDESKGIDTAIRAMAHMPAPITLEVLGPPEPAHLSRLRQVADEAGVANRVRFGSAARHELAAHYQAADALLFPSEWREPFGIVPLEAMASGAVVVATGSGGSGEYLVDDDNSVLFTAGDASALAVAVNRVATDDDLRHRLRDGGRATAARLSITKTADRLESLLVEAAQRRSQHQRAIADRRRGSSRRSRRARRPS